MFAAPVNVAALTTDGGGTTLLTSRTITTSGSQTYNEAVAIGGIVNLFMTGGGAITFAGTVDGEVGNPGGLFVNVTDHDAQLLFQGAIGGGNNLGGLNIGDAGPVVIAVPSNT